MLATLSSAQYSELLAYDSLEPIGEERADLRAGIIASAVANFAGKMLKEGHQTKALDFMPFSKQYEENQTSEQQKKIVELIKEATGN